MHSAQYITDCLIGSLKLAKGAVKAGIKRLVGIGTCLEYDLSLGTLSVDAPLKPITPYADTKVALYSSLSNLLPLCAVEFAWCRLFYLYGEDEDHRRLMGYLHSKLENCAFIAKKILSSVSPVESDT